MHTGFYHIRRCSRNMKYIGFWLLLCPLCDFLGCYSLFIFSPHSLRVRRLPRHAVRVHSIKSLMPRPYLHQGGQETKAISFVRQMTIETISLCVSAEVFLRRSYVCFLDILSLLELSWFAPRLFCVFLVFVAVTLRLFCVCAVSFCVSWGCFVSLRLLCVSWRLFPVLVVSFCSFFEGVFASPPSVCVSLGLFWVSVFLCDYFLCLRFCVFFCVSGVHFCLLEVAVWLFDVVFCFQCMFVPLFGYLVSFCYPTCICDVILCVVLII